MNSEHKYLVPYSVILMIYQQRSHVHKATSVVIIHMFDLTYKIITSKLYLCNSLKTIRSSFSVLTLSPGHHVAAKVPKVNKLPKDIPTRPSTTTGPCPCLCSEAARRPRQHSTTSGGWI